jgi:glutamyl-Q tRNA(Asp) synthetase
MRYRGRFAPSPTGPLHFGSLVAALASYLDARAHQGEWLVRIEDIDRPREVPGAADLILRTLETFGFEWDGEIAYQSKRDPLYRDYAESLRELDLLYACGCSRKEWRQQARMGVEGAIYPGICRNGLPEGKQARAERVRTGDKLIELNDAVQGQLRQSLARDVGDFIIRRADGLYAYQFAVVIDDACQGVSHVVRGADLLLSTPRQVYLQSLLRFPTPRYAHIPLALDESGRKLSKQYAAQPVDAARPAAALHAALAHLGQPACADETDNPHEILDWALTHWDRSRIPPSASIKSGGED